MFNNKIININKTTKKSDLISYYDPNSYSCSFSSLGSNSSISSNSIKFENDIISPSYDSRLSKMTSNGKNSIYERHEYIEFITKQNTYLNNKKYQIIFNQIIFNFKL
jgi:hypothetical protein